jgi:hypothetical protein
MQSSSDNTLFLKEVVDNAGILASSTWTNRAIAFVTSLLVIRTLGPDLYGAYALGRKIFELVFILSVFELDLAKEETDLFRLYFRKIGFRYRP